MSRRRARISRSGTGKTDFVLDVCGMTSDGAKLFCLFFEILDFEI